MTTLIKWYRHKSIEVEVYQWREVMGQTRGVYRGGESGKFFVVTGSGKRIYLKDLDWIVCGASRGHHYVIAPGVFKLIYDLIDDSEAISYKEVPTGGARGQALDTTRPSDDEPIIVDDKEVPGGMEIVQESASFPTREDEG